MSEPLHHPLPPVLQDYTPRAGVADELFDAQGNMRPVWRAFIDQMTALSPQEIESRFARGDQYLRDAGVYFRLYSGGPAQERSWPLSHVPVLISDAEWQTICDGLAQRADLLERIVADLYGSAQLVAEGHLPAELVAGNPHWLHPLVGTTPASGHWLHHLAFEIGRSPDGSFFVLGDRTEAPSGAGFALENRMAATRIFTDPFPRSNLRRLAGFFRSFRATMEALAGEGRHMAILTPGPNNDTYYEHTYIARYLGLMLLEGEDLIVENGQAMVRTVRGLEPLGLLWRRIDDEFVDPLELMEASQLGTPGLLGAFRQGGLNLINAPGSGVLETRAFMAFFPRIARHLLGETLILPNIATWWCGQPAERAHVQAHAKSMIIGSALEKTLPFAAGADAALGAANLTMADWPLEDWIGRNGHNLVAQQAVRLSTTPVWSNGRLVPRPMTIRVFATRTAQGWTFMPGGYARIGKSDDTNALAMQAGGSVADVWVMAPRAVPPDSLAPTAVFERETAGILPARAADNLYWLGRYVERTEGAIRLLRAYHLRLAETGDSNEPRLDMLAAYLASLGIAPDRPVPEALSELIAAARMAASKVRDRFSPDGWQALNDLAKTTARFAQVVAAGDDAARAMSVLLRKLSGFSGLVHENMYRYLGWRFLSLGRAQERADAMLLQLMSFATTESAPGIFEIAIETGDCIMTHQRRYRFGPSRETVLDLLVLDPDNPRGVLYQISEMRAHIAQLPHESDRDRLSTVEKLLLEMDTDLRVADPADLSQEELARFRARLATVSDRLSARYFR
ncbi:MAG: circularly permuted type 2 ATP-grasp protein [Natronohydrobacter sp.]|nr:circularly permuted type 2 ATP-grasp protein [Natronohydrobacter sp.]